jgi:hypothetical protein
MGETVKKQVATGAILVAALTAFVMMGASESAAQESSATPATPALDFEYFKAHVEPIFLKHRGHHARCYVCHAVVGTNSAFQLQKLSPGSTFWTEEQSRLNFEVVSRLVIPGDPVKSRLLTHPLPYTEGGDLYVFHRGNWQFASRNDPDWLTIAEWVRGQKESGSPAK